jgi:hypothetical protein
MAGGPGRIVAAGAVVADYSVVVVIAAEAEVCKRGQAQSAYAEAQETGSMRLPVHARVSPLSSVWVPSSVTL